MYPADAICSLRERGFISYRILCSKIYRFAEGGISLYFYAVVAECGSKCRGCALRARIRAEDFAFVIGLFEPSGRSQTAPTVRL